MKRATSAVVGLSLVTTLAMSSCESGGGPEGVLSEGTSNVTVLLTDAQGPLEHVWIDITQVYLQGGPTGGRTILLDDPTGLIDVLPLVDDTLMLADSVPVPAGRYAQLRVVIEDLVVELTSGEVFATSGADIPGGLIPTGTIVCPSCSSSGIKVILPHEDLSLIADATLTVDFDAAQTFVHGAGESGRWIVHPVIKLSDFVTLED